MCGRPLVSVIIPSYNHVNYVGQSIRSVWRQTYNKIELIVVDDASTDGTAEVVSELESESPIPMWVVKKSHNRGVSNSLNIGLSMASGEWVGFLSSDDYYITNKIERQIEIALTSPGEYGCIHTNAFSISEDGSILKARKQGAGRNILHGDCFESLLYAKGMVMPTSALIKRTCIDMVGQFDESMIAEDYDYFLRLSRGTKFYYLDEHLLCVRALPGSLGRRPWLWVDGIFRAIEKHVDMPGYDWTEVRIQRWMPLLQLFFEVGGPVEIYRALSKALEEAIGFENKTKIIKHLPLMAARAALSRQKKMFMNSVRMMKNNLKV